MIYESSLDHHSRVEPIILIILIAHATRSFSQPASRLAYEALCIPSQHKAKELYTPNVPLGSRAVGYDKQCALETQAASFTTFKNPSHHAVMYTVIGQ